jgi:hypothetical protein
MQLNQQLNQQEGRRSSGTIETRKRHEAEDTEHGCHLAGKSAEPEGDSTNGERKKQNGRQCNK